ncbi:MAG: DOMON-like domain-containing protein [Candidatus Accumulibacter sp.]|jgi:hypothetical protein|nr:DOMON-like domain-containing protein [Accumulibacter sp.]
MPESSHLLIRHPATPAPMVRAIEAGVFLAGGHVVFRYVLRGDMARVRIPAERLPERGDSLWEQTCFEAFAGLEGDSGYREFNFSPSGRWAVYDFGDYRRRLPDPEVAAPRIAARATEGRLELEAIAPLSSLPPALSGAAWEIGLSAVVETTDAVDGGRSYWALRHSSPRPDFHLRDSFALRLPAFPE